MEMVEMEEFEWISVWDRMKVGDPVGNVKMVGTSLGDASTPAPAGAPPPFVEMVGSS